MLESEYKTHLKKRIRGMFHGCVILLGNSATQQGIPDWLILWHGRWAFLEVKKSIDAPLRPNQDYWVAELNAMSFAAFIYPENEDEVLSALQRQFTSRRQPRISRR